MKAMILAAGMGTRLRPLTNDRPKALVEVGGRTLLEITLLRLRSFGVQDVIVNVHHFPDMIVDYVGANDYFGMRIEISREEVLLDTGGGLKKAAYFFLQDSSHQDEPFILHNVDVVSTIDLRRMMQFHSEHRALVTLAVQDRKSSRRLLFDGEGRLCGRRDDRNETTELARPAENLRALAFAGIHIISPRFLPMMTEEGIFSILVPYLRLAAVQERILAFRADEYYWRDLGKPESITKANEELKQHMVLS
jgi:NDP-sugar pyrophosphorylase family protein